MTRIASRLLVTAFLLALATSAAADPNCGGPCVVVLPNSGFHDCGPYSHMELRNSAPQAATVTLQVSIDEKAHTTTRTDVRELGPRATLYLGCSGTLTPTVSQRITWGVQAVRWH